MEWIADYVRETDEAALFILITSIVMLGGMMLFMFYCLFKFRKSNNPKPSPIEGHLGLEIVWTVIPTILVMIMFYWGFIGFQHMRTPPKDSLKVKVIARQWSWSFEYENGKVSDVLVVPQGKPIYCAIESVDVVHSFYLPVYRIKEDAVPGLSTYTWFYPDKQGEFDIFCAEYCGDQHAFMLAKLKVVSQEEFDKWLQETGPMDGREVLKLRGCLTCHSLTKEKKIGPGFLGIFGQKRTVITDGKERTIQVDEAYIRRSILEPKKDVVKGFPPAMPPQNLKDEEIQAVIDFLKQLK